MKKQNKYKYASKLMPKKVAIEQKDLSLEERSANAERIMRYKQMWDNNRGFRDKRKRFAKYTFGNQWGDLIEVDGKMITEEMNIKMQGKVPLKNNMIRQLVKTVEGVFRSQNTVPEARSRVRDMQKLGEMMTIAVQYAHQTNELKEVDAKCLQEFMISAVCCQMVRYKWWVSKQDYDVYVEDVNPARLFFNNNLNDVRTGDIHTIGMIQDLTLKDVIETFATKKEEKERIKNIYKDRAIENYYDTYRNFDRRQVDNLDFLRPLENNLCRVIQAWELEGRDRVRVHDPLEGRLFIVEAADVKQLEAENATRLSDAMANGVDKETAEENILMKFYWFYDRYWNCRYLSPFGDVLLEMETPFTHKEHPFVIAFAPLIDGEIHSFVEDVIDQQRYINRLITMIDFIMGASAKGVLVFPEDALGDMTKEEVIDEWSRYNGVIFAKIRNGAPLPTQISTNATNIGANELLALQMKLMQNISGVYGAMQGASAKSGTPSSLYAQESQNAQTNLLGLIEAFNAFRRRRDWKMMKIIQQYYQTERYIALSGRQYDEESRWYEPKKIQQADFDIAIADTAATPAVRALNNQLLLNAFQTGMIDFETLLETGSFPFADNVIDHLQARKQQAMQEQMALQQSQLPQGAPAGGMTPEMQAQAAQANPQAMELINQALQN